MTVIIFLAFFIIVIMILIQTKTQKKSIKTEDLPYKRKKLLSEAECNFYQVLKNILPENRQITCKPRLEDLLYVEKSSSRNSYRGKIQNRHIDFVIFNPVNGYTDFAIELDDKSHETEKQKQIDKFKDDVFRKIGMPLIRIPARRTYDPKELIEEINKKIKK